MEKVQKLKPVWPSLIISLNPQIKVDPWFENSIEILILIEIINANHTTTVETRQTEIIKLHNTL